MAPVAAATATGRRASPCSATTPRCASRSTRPGCCAPIPPRPMRCSSCRARRCRARTPPRPRCGWPPSSPPWSEPRRGGASGASRARRARPAARPRSRRPPCGASAGSPPASTRSAGAGSSTCRPSRRRRISTRCWRCCTAATPRTSSRSRAARSRTARLQPSSSGRPGAGPVCRPEGTYVVTGGTGALGLSIAQWLAGRGARRIVLVGRRAALSREGREARRALEAAGVTVRPARRRRRATAGGWPGCWRRDELGLTRVRGVVHAAGVVDNRFIGELDEPSLRDVMGPKVLGATVLHELFPPGTLDFFVLFSSAGQLLHLPGQAAYAAANAFLDGLARHRRVGGHRETLALAWTSWRGLGDVDVVGRDRRRAARARDGRHQRRRGVPGVGLRRRAPGRQPRRAARAAGRGRTPLLRDVVSDDPAPAPARPSGGASSRATRARRCSLTEVRPPPPRRSAPIRTPSTPSGRCRPGRRLAAGRRAARRARRAAGDRAARHVALEATPPWPRSRHISPTKEPDMTRPPRELAAFAGNPSRTSNARAARCTRCPGRSSRRCSSRRCGCASRSCAIGSRCCARWPASSTSTSSTALEDVVPLLFPHTVYKSYPPSLLSTTTFDRLTTGCRG